MQRTTNGPAVAIAPRSPRPRSDFNPNVHGARGLFAAALLLFHVANSNLPTAPVLAADVPMFLFLALQFGVEMFFCISGFVIAGTLRRARSPAAFLVDRAIRIMPVLWATMPIVLALEFAGHAPEVAGLSPFQFVVALLGNLLCLPNVVPMRLFHLAAWSLSYEMAFYAFCTVAWLAWRRSSRGAWALVAPAVLLLALYPRAVFFLVGVGAAEGWFRHPLLQRLSRYPVPFVLVFLLAWQQVRMLNGISLETSINGWWGDARLPFAALAVLAAIPFFQGTVDGVGRYGGWLRSRPLQWLGTVSYSLYLWQFLTMAVVKRAMHASGLVDALGPWSQAAFLLLAVPPTLLVAWLSQRVLERGVSGRLRRWARRLEARDVGEARTAHA